MLRRIALSVVAAVAVCVAANQASAQAPICEYNPFTGQIVFKNLNNVFAMRLFSTSGALVGGSTGNELGFSLTERTPTLYSWLTFGPGVTSPEANAGNIVTAQGALLPDTDYSFDYVVGTFSGDITPGDFVRIPEPSTMALAGLGVVGAVAIRRRRRAA